MTEVTKDKLALAKQFHKEGASIAEACRRAGLSKATYSYHVYKHDGGAAKGLRKRSVGLRGGVRDTVVPVGIRTAEIKGFPGGVALIFGTPQDVGRVLNAAWSGARM